MLKKSLVALSFLTLPLTASADWLAGGGYANFSAENDGTDVSLGTIFGSVGYEFMAEGSEFSFMPELRLGTGVSDDTIGSVKIEIERFTAFSIRGQYNYDNGVYLYVMPSYANLDVKASYNGHSDSDDDWEFGFGGGVGKKMNENMSIEASFESYDETDVFTVGFKYAF